MKFSEIIQEISDLDLKFLRTFWSLFYRPGYVVRNRNQFTSPLKYALLLTSLSCGSILLMRYVIGADNPDYSWIIPKKISEAFERREQLYWNFLPARILVQLVPLSYILMCAFFRSMRSDLKEAIDPALYLSAQTSAIFNIIVAGFNSVPNFAGEDLIEYGVACLYAALAMGDMIGKPRLLNVMKSLALVVVLAFAYNIFTERLMDGLSNAIINNSIKGLKAVTTWSEKKSIRHDFGEYAGKIIGFSTEESIIIINQKESSSVIYEVTKGKVGPTSTLPFVARALRPDLDLWLELSKVGVLTLHRGTEDTIALALGDSARIWDVQMRMLSSSVGFLVVAGAKVTAQSRHPFICLVWLKWTNSRLQVERVKTTNFGQEQGSYSHIVLADSGYFKMLETVNSNLETKDLMVQFSSYSEPDKIKWMRVIETRDSKYGPGFTMMKQDSEKEKLYATYIIPNDTNYTMHIIALQSRGGHVDYDRKLKLPTERTFISHLVVDKDYLFFLGTSANPLSGRAIISADIYGTLLAVKKETGEPMKVVHFGRERLGNSATWPITINVSNDSLSVVSTWRYDVLGVDKSVFYMFTMPVSDLISSASNSAKP
jgi:hypothetical protein